MFYIPQNERSDCGFTCLKILLANLNHDKNYLFLSSPKRKNQPFTFYELCNYARKYGVDLEGFTVEDNNELYKAKDTPFIICLYSKNNRHAVYVYKVKGKYIYYYDPNIGKVKRLIKDVIPLWDGTGLIHREYTLTKCPNKRISLLKLKEKVMLLLMELTSSVGLISGIYYLQKDSIIIYPIVCFSIFIIFEILLRKLSITYMAKMDERLKEEGNVKSRNFKDFYYHYEEYKKLEVVLPLNLVGNLIIVSSLIVLLAINDTQNLYYILSSIAFAIVLALVINPRLKKEREEIAIQEKEISHVEDNHHLSVFLNAIHKRSYKYGLKELSIKYLLIFGELIIILLVMASVNKIQLTYVVFYLCTNYLLTTKLIEILEYPKRMREFDVVSAKLSNNMIKK